MKGLIAFILIVTICDSSTSGESLSGDSLVRGIRFERNIKWSNILSKAKEKNKYIIVDCFTTWCGPCKKMDAEVYQNKEVGEFANLNFISIKLQMDTTKGDDESSRLLFSTAKEFTKKYNIVAFPTILIFNSKGQIINKMVGLMGVNDFTGALKGALDSSQDFYHLLKLYINGKRDLKDIISLKRKAIQLVGDTILASKLEKDYLSSLDKNNWLTKENIDFLEECTRFSTDTGFSLFYHYTDTINKIESSNDFSQSVIRRIIFNEMVLPVFHDAEKSKVTPKWDILYSGIQRKYSDIYAKRLDILAKLYWEKAHQNFETYIKYYVLYYNTFIPWDSTYSDSIFDGVVWNNRAWEVFRYSKNPAELRIAMSWSSRAMTENPSGGYFDTYSNLLYKLGYARVAIAWEELAVKMDPQNRELQTNLQSMMNNKPTW